MNDLLSFIDRCVYDAHIPFCLEMRFNGKSGWNIHIWQERPTLFSEKICQIQVQDKDYGFCCAKAYVALKDWLQENKK